MQFTARNYNGGNLIKEKTPLKQNNVKQKLMKIQH